MPAHLAPVPARRDPALDVLRGVAVLLVLLRHTHAPHGALGVVGDALKHFANLVGDAGVDLFFVLSGFLVSGLLFREYAERGRVNLGRFLVRRGFKIYPAYYLFLALTIPWQWQSEGLSASWLWSQLLFVQNYAPTILPWGHTWSLAVEEHFYLLLAGATALGLSWRALRRERIPTVLLLVMFLALMLRIVHAAAWLPFSHDTHVAPTHLRLDSLALGVLVRYYQHAHPVAYRAWLRRHFPTDRRLLLASLLLLAPQALWATRTPFMHTLGYTTTAVGFAGLLCWAQRSRLGTGDGVGGALARAIGAVGLYSYSIYIWHQIALVAPGYLARSVGMTVPYLFDLAAYLLGAVVLGIVMGKAVEQPLLLVRDRYFPAWRPPRSVPTPAPATATSR